MPVESVWQVITRANLVGRQISVFDVWLESFLEENLRGVEKTVAAALGARGVVESWFKGAQKGCGKCNGVVSRSNWREVTLSAEARFPGLKFYCAENIGSTDGKFSSLSLLECLDIFGAERAVIDGKLVLKSGMESDLLESSLRISRGWQDELMVVLGWEPGDDWCGFVLGVDSERKVLFREEVTAAGRCSVCGVEVAVEPFDFAKFLDQPGETWLVEGKSCARFRDYSVGDFYAEQSARRELARRVGVAELGLLQNVVDLSREQAFGLWAFLQAGIESGRVLVSFDVPSGGRSGEREAIVEQVVANSGWLVMDEESGARFFEVQKRREGGVLGERRYRCSWGRQRGPLAYRLGIFEKVVAPFFESAEARVSGVTRGSYAAVGCKECVGQSCRRCRGVGVLERFCGLKALGLELGQWMRLPIEEAAGAARGEVGELLRRLVALGFGKMTLGGCGFKRESPVWFGYEWYVREVLGGSNGNSTELTALLPP